MLRNDCNASDRTACRVDLNPVDQVAGCQNGPNRLGNKGMRGSSGVLPWSSVITPMRFDESLNLGHVEDLHKAFVFFQWVHLYDHFRKVLLEIGSGHRIVLVPEPSGSPLLVLSFKKLPYIVKVPIPKIT